ncbi:MAG: UDP-2,3-diacylglucosamine diphosphatase [Bacteroidia bacterium]|nr:UDP-2,3-diacylglucosamine diphosphatase [Bacteroidia bacterium]
MKTYFVSDAHLGSWYLEDRLANEKKLVRWMDSIKPDCEALYLLGDMMDFWFEYKQAIPKGFARFFGKIAEFTDAGIPVYWFAGNHDIWLFDYVQKELGVIVYFQDTEVVIQGKKFYLAHGDGLGDPSNQFRMLRGIFHSKVNQKLFSWLHPDLGLKFGLSWARHSRKKREYHPETYLGEDNEYLIQFSKKHQTQKGADAPDFYIYGHRHILLDLLISAKSRIIILGDWFRLFTYASFDGTDFDLLPFEE